MSAGRPDVRIHAEVDGRGGRDGAPTTSHRPQVVVDDDLRADLIVIGLDPGPGISIPDSSRAALPGGVLLTPAPTALRVTPGESPGP